MKTIGIFVGLSMVLMLASVLRPSTVLGANEGDDLKKLQERVDELERAVLEDPFHPNQTLLSRMKASEEAIRDLQKREVNTAKAEGKDDESIRKSIAALEKDRDELNRRLKAAEERVRRDAGDNDLRDLKRALEQLDRAVDDLDSRVKRLEAKK